MRVEGALVLGGVVALLAGAAGAVLAPRLAALAARAPREVWFLQRPALAVVLAIGTGLPTASLALAGAPAYMWPGLAVTWWAACAAACIDAASHRLPDVLVLRVGGLGVALLLLGALLAPAPLPWGVRALGVLAGAAIGYGVLGAIAFAYPPGMGYGDVKLAALLGAALGGPLLAGAGLVAGFVLGGVLSLALLALRRVTRRTELPFGPVLAAAAVLVAFAAGVDAATGVMNAVEG